MMVMVMVTRREEEARKVAEEAARLKAERDAALENSRWVISFLLLVFFFFLTRGVLCLRTAVLEIDYDHPCSELFLLKGKFGK